jgi:hypothetical protein
VKLSASTNTCENRVDDRPHMNVKNRITLKFFI